MTFFRCIPRTFLFLALMCLGVAAHPTPASAQAPSFLSVIDDLPLMPGFVEDVVGALEFEAANGRIAETTATGSATTEAVFAFYSQTLPQLGWQLETHSLYRREGESLLIDVAELDGGDQSQVQIHFRLSPVEEK